MLNFFKHSNINAKTQCGISGQHLNSKRVSPFNENFVSLLNTLDSENRHKDQNSEGKKTVNTEVSEDSVVTDNEIDGFTNIGLLRKKHIKNSFFGHLNITIPHYKLIRKDRNQHGGGLTFYVNQDIPCKTINTFNFPNSLEVILLEINLRNKKALVIGCCKPPSLNDEYFVDRLHGALSFYGNTYDNFLLLG